MQGFRVCCTAAWGASTVNNSGSWMGTRLWSELWYAVHSIILEQHFSTVEPHWMSTGQWGWYELAVTGQMITTQSIQACHVYSGSGMNTDESRSHLVPMHVRSEILVHLKAQTNSLMSDPSYTACAFRLRLVTESDPPAPPKTPATSAA